MDKNKDFESEGSYKLCSISSSGDQVASERIKRQARKGQFVCSRCGRYAVDSEKLCAPEKA
jgi:hypothetical protein